MSRVGKRPIEVPDNADVSIEGTSVKVKGPKGELELTVSERVRLLREGNIIRVERVSDNKLDKSLHGLTRTLIQNMITGVTQGFQKTLEIQGVGYRAALKGDSLELLLGYSKPVVYRLPEGIEAEVPTPTRVIIKGCDKQKVGQVAAEIRSLRKPDPYKGKGIRYSDEYIRRKVGKAVK